MLVDEPKGSDRGYYSEETGYNPTYIMRLKYDLAVLKERRSPFRCLWRKASRIIR